MKNQNGQGLVEFLVALLFITVIAVMVYDFILVPVFGFPPIIFPKGF